MKIRTILPDPSPLFQYRNYGWIYLSQLVSFMGSMITYVAIPYQMYQITHSTFYVGLIGLVQLIPMIFFGLIAGTWADIYDRKKMTLIGGYLGAMGNVALIYFTLQNQMTAPLLLTLAGLMASSKALERPPLEALTQMCIPREVYSKVASLQSFKSTAGQIVGPMVGGVLISAFGLQVTYIIDLATYLFSFWCLGQYNGPTKVIQADPLALITIKQQWRNLCTGLTFALSSSILLGSYLVDIVAMIFANPHPLFPELAESFNHPESIGTLYSSLAFGGLLAVLTSGWCVKIKRHGLMITVSAMIWCGFIFAFAITPSWWGKIACLFLAGYADMVSGIFRSTLWNELIPTSHRGRLAGVEMISYTSGPLLGSALMGQVAAMTSIHQAPMMLSILGLGACYAVAMMLRPFWRYQSNLSGAARTSP
jgi:MFS family permease